MKTHAKHFALGGLLTPTALATAAAIANETQTLLGLQFRGTALAIFIFGFIFGAALVMSGQLRLEVQKLIGEVGSGGLDLGAILGSLGNLGGLLEPEAPTPASPPPPPAPGTLNPPRPPQP